MDSPVADPTAHGGITLEIERCCNCSNHQYCTQHVEARYEEYEEKVKDAIQAKVSKPDTMVTYTNPGPKAIGMDVNQSQYQDCLYMSMVRNHVSGRYLPDVCFRYPRIGGFEITVMRGGLRNNGSRQVVFSKLRTKKWPNPEWIAEKVVETVEAKLGGFKIIKEEGPQETFATKQLTDEDLREILMKKFQSVISGFRQFDEDGDGIVNPTEFVRGLKSCGIDLPKDHYKRLWKMADQDGSGQLNFREFAKKFQKYRASHQRNIGDPHSKKSKHQIRTNHSENEKFGVDENSSMYDANKSILPKSITQLARDSKAIMNVPLNQCSPDIIRAKIVAKHGNLLQGFRQFDTDGDNVITVDEFERRLPAVLGVKQVPEQIIEDIFDIFDRDMTGEIDLKEFCSDKFCSENHSGSRAFMGQQYGTGTSSPKHSSGMATPAGASATSASLAASGGTPENKNRVSKNESSNAESSTSS